MKNLTALILCLLLLAGCASPAVYDGPTKSAWVLTEQTTTSFYPRTGETWTDRRTFQYDSFGNVVRSCFYSEGELSSEYRREYDDRGNMISTVTWEHGSFLSYPRSRTDYTFDDQNRPLATIYRNFLGFEKSRDTYTYDDEANTVLWEGTYDTQTKWLDENGSPLRVLTLSHAAGVEMESIHEYDGRGRSVKITSLWDGALFSILELAYDDQDRLTLEVSYDADGTVASRRTYQYGENTVTTYELGGAWTVETYRSDGQIEKMEQFNKSGELTMRTEYIYKEIQIPADREE